MQHSGTKNNLKELCLSGPLLGCLFGLLSWIHHHSNRAGNFRAQLMFKDGVFKDDRLLQYRVFIEGTSSGI